MKINSEDFRVRPGEEAKLGQRAVRQWTNDTKGQLLGGLVYVKRGHCCLRCVSGSDRSQAFILPSEACTPSLRRKVIIGHQFVNAD